MKTGVSTASLFLRRYNEQALPLLDGMGVKTAEVFLTTYSEYGERFAKQLQKVQGGVDINSVHILNTQFEPQLFNAHPRAKADAFAWLDKVLESAQILGAPYYTFHGTARIKKAARSGKNDDFTRMRAAFEEISAACQKRGVRLCLENVEWATYNRPGVFAELAKAVPALGGVLDIKQARISGFPYQAYLEEMGEKLCYVHVSDVDEQGKICLPGKGTFDFTTLIKRLQDVGFDGALLVEVYTGDYKEEQELKLACEYLDELIDKYKK